MLGMDVITTRNAPIEIEGLVGGTSDPEQVSRSLMYVNMRTDRTYTYVHKRANMYYTLHTHAYKRVIIAITYQYVHKHAVCVRQ